MDAIVAIDTVVSWDFYNSIYLESIEST